MRVNLKGQMVNNELEILVELSSTLMFFKHSAWVIMPEKVRFIASLFSTSPPPPQKNNTDVDQDKLEQKDMF